MDCSLAEQNSVNSLDETIRSLTQLASSGSPLRRENTFTSATAQQVTVLSSSPSSTAAAIQTAAAIKLRKYSDRCLTTAEAKSHTYRISMANLEETQESELDMILGELSLLEAQINCGDAAFLPGCGVPGPQQHVNQTSGLNMGTAPPTRTHSRTNSTISGATTISLSGSSECGSSATTHSLASSSGVSENGQSSVGSGGSVSSVMGVTMVGVGGGVVGIMREPRTESPDNDSAFSDTVSLLSSESSASSSASSALHHKQMQQLQQQQQLQYMQQQLSGTTLSSSKAAKIQLALHKLEHPSIRRLFVKAFTSDGASKSLLVDERMTCGHVTRLLADKNHVHMQANWALVENLGDLQMERLFEDHELLVDNLMTWNSDAGNRVLFQQRSDKVSLFAKPEIYLPGPQMAPGSQHDEHTRAMLLEEFFETNSQLQVDGPLYMKADSKKGWKRYHFVLRSSGLYYFPKEKTKNTRDLACLTLFNGYNVYRGLGWKKKWKSPTDYAFGFKSAVDSSLGKTCRTLKMLCAEDLETMEKWITAIRISKYGKQLWDSHKTLMDDLSLGDVMSHSSFGVSMRSESISSISSAVPSQCGSVSSAVSSMSNSSGRVSRASSSSSSGCLSDDNNGFDSEFTTGTIKRKPSMKPNLPLTTMTRQLKEVGEITICEGSGADVQDATSPERSGTLTRRHSRRKSQESNGSGTLKRRQPTAAVAKRGSAESMNATACNSSGSSNSTPTPTPSICTKPLLEYEASRATPVNDVPGVANCMSSSTLSLDSLPPPPPPPPITDEHEIYGSQLSLVSLPPPPPPEDVMVYSQPPQEYACAGGLKSNGMPPAVPAKPQKSQQTPVKGPAPPYKAPPEYVGQAHTQHMNNSNNNSGINAAAAAGLPPPPPPTNTGTQKKVSFADSPVLLRRKMCSPEPPVCVMQMHAQPIYGYAPCPLPPPRADMTRLSTNSSNCSSIDFGSPKRLQESTSNPPRDFLKDLQRVMRKKWQVAQKCKLEPATTPHEVLGFRDFNDELHNLNASATTHYYRETANVSNWVQEHYGAGAPPPPPSEYALYENLHANDAPNGMGGTAVMMEPQFPMSGTAVAAAAAQRKKRPPPPPPKRSDSTQLTHRV
ncbi:PREDICTED: ras-associated and pleckstrin homology domains-containing protein 1 isoform X2 [Bactrocera latifrons]|uniref:Ras-associated and pleckstrin y domains-containing protein 1 n=1 Tax=Bactrocera latifrons TaxID=174628 RepID=A0A0K8VZN4_BACLA|nr:PREDICTED: ras-associated and pleckstrin homology domains-containing protein 1 isoform X2 [Bactrocera latifrons]